MKKVFFCIFFYFTIYFLNAQNLVVDGSISNAVNWNGQESPYNAGTYENVYLATGCGSNYVMEVDNGSVPTQTVTGFTSGVQYVLSFRCAYRTSCAPSNNPTNLQITFTDAPGTLTYTLSIPSSQSVLTAFSFTFTNNASATHTLQFTSPGNANTCGTIVDDISIVPLSSPGGVGTGNLSFWIRAGVINQTDNTGVYGWISQGINVVPLTPPCAAAPVYKTGLASVANNLVANYNPYLTFNGSTQYLEYVAARVNLLNNAGGAAGGSFFSVYEGGSNTTTPFAHQSSNNSRIHNRTDLLVHANSTTTGTNNSAAITKSTRVNIISSKGSSTLVSLADINGLNQAVANGSLDADYITTGVRRNVAGTYSQFFDGALSEVITFNTVLTNTQAHQVRSYLASKYGVTLTDNSTTAGLDERSYIASDGATVLWNYATNSVYHNNVTVIGRDDGTALTQVRSISTDADGGSNTGSTMLMVDNVATIGSDKSFFATGHNGITIPSGANFVDVPIGIQSRLLRVWKFQKTGAGIANSVTVRFDMTGFAPLTGSDLRLLVSNSSVFAGASIISGSYAAPYFTASLPTTGGVFFTVGSINATATPLPMTLLNFDAQQEKENIELKWSTASESNTDFFTVQRSIDGINYTDLGIIKASGTSTIKKDYRYTDKNPLSGVSYYRLKLTNNNASIETYNPVSVNLKKDNNTVFSIFPNPNSGHFTLDFSGIENNHEVQVVVLNEQGKEVFNSIFYSRSLERNEVQLNLKEKVTSGVYYCKITSEGISQTIKVLVN